MHEFPPADKYNVAYFKDFLEGQSEPDDIFEKVRQCEARVMEFLFFAHTNKESGKKTYTGRIILRPVIFYRKLNIPGVNC